jgi:glycosyltransferase involved in cell wall biosynthesis
MVEGVTVRTLVDNCERSVGDKRQQLLNEARGEYVCFVDDDDWVDDEYLPAIMAVLPTRPDHVGFRVRFTENGVIRPERVHSLARPDYTLSTWNPLRASLAAQGKFSGGVGEDRRWAAGVMRNGLVLTEVFIDQALYHYRWSAADSIQKGTVRRCT